MRERLLELIPDTPTWVETRGALLAGGEIYGEPGAAVVRSRWKDTICVIGRPADATLDAAFEGAAEIVEVIAQDDDAQHGEYLMDMPGAEARIYTAGAKPPRLPIVEGDYLIEELGEADLPRLRHLPEPLYDELEEELAARTRMVAAVADGLPVSFCYVASETERWWDISIDTWEPFRRRGLAGAAFGGLYERMAGEGKGVVWGAMEWNEASWRLAEKLGLGRVGSVHVWTAHSLNLDDYGDDPEDKSRDSATPAC
jgi:hypothetical protein